jgi:L-aminopeptidase/D-esterase-like protein
VVGLVIYDLGVGDPAVRPGPQDGYAACVAAQAGPLPPARGPVAAGAGATVGKWRGADAAREAGLGSALTRHDDVTVAALVVVNALGDLWSEADERPRICSPAAGPTVAGEATTIGVVVTDARLDKTECRLVAESAHDGLARAIDPVHTAGDGDAFVAAATGRVEAPVHVVRSLAAWVVAAAVRDALTPAD